MNLTLLVQELGLIWKRTVSKSAFFPSLLSLPSLSFESQPGALDDRRTFLNYTYLQACMVMRAKDSRIAKAARELRNLPASNGSKCKQIFTMSCQGCCSAFLELCQKCQGSKWEGGRLLSGGFWPSNGCLLSHQIKCDKTWSFCAQTALLFPLPQCIATHVAPTP